MSASTVPAKEQVDKKKTDEKKTDPQTEAYLKLMELNSQIAMAGPLDGKNPMLDSLMQYKNLLSVVATGCTPEQLQNVTARQVRDNLLERHIAAAKANLMLSNSGIIYYPITWKSEILTIKLKTSLTSQEFDVEYVYADPDGSCSDSDGEAAKYVLTKEVDKATHLCLHV